MTWSSPRLGRVDTDEQCRCPNLQHPHAASYRAEITDERGVVSRQYLCTNRAALFAGRWGIDFPPGRWSDAPSLTKEAQ